MKYIIKEKILSVLVGFGIIISGALYANPGVAEYPEEPVTLLIPYKAGGSTETMARVYSIALGSALGTKVIVKTKPGAGGAIGATEVSNAPADGYTLLFAAASTLLWPPLTQDVEYDLNTVRFQKTVKPIYFTQFPKDLDELQSTRLKKETFIKIVLPLIVAENERISADREKLKKISDPNRVVFMGNSITMDWSDYDASFFSENPFVNRGIGGQTSPQMLVRFRSDVVSLNPKAVVIFAGTNDIAGNTGLISLENTAENIFSMAEIAMANNIAVYICSTLPAIDFLWSPGLEPATKIVKLNSILKSYCEENGLTYVDYYSAMVDADGGLKVPEYTAANDLSHPNLEGYKVMEEIILASLKK